MNVKELNSDQLDYLRFNLFYGDDGVELTSKQQMVIDNCVFFWDVPDELVYDVYDGISFVEEDFA